MSASAAQSAAVALGASRLDARSARSAASAQRSFNDHPARAAALTHEQVGVRRQAEEEETGWDESGIDHPLQPGPANRGLFQVRYLGGDIQRRGTAQGRLAERGPVPQQVHLGESPAVQSSLFGEYRALDCPPARLPRHRTRVPGTR
jgi:hypothetical protein